MHSGLVPTAGQAKCLRYPLTRLLFLIPSATARAARSRVQPDWIALGEARRLGNQDWLMLCMLAPADKPENGDNREDR